MKLYKYKSLNDLSHALDILLNNRLHCAHLENLNDPIEGHFIAKFLIGKRHFVREDAGKKIYCSYPAQTKMISSLDSPAKGVQELRDTINRKRICALSKSKNDIRLWSHYADGHKGIAIEIDIPDHDIVPYGGDRTVFGDKKIFEVDYQEDFAQLIHGLESKIIEQEALKALRTKLRFWDYESEIRIIQEEDYYAFPVSITRVYCGYNSGEESGSLNHLQRLFPRINFLKAKLNCEPPWITFDEN